MAHKLYKSFTLFVLGINSNSWDAACTKSAFCNLILQDNDVIMYYYENDIYCNGRPVSLHGNLTNMARILARLTLLLIGTNALTPYIIELVWGEDANARLALGGPQGDLSLVR